jgi:hypothetical protein
MLVDASGSGRGHWSGCQMRHLSLICKYMLTRYETLAKEAHTREGPLGAIGLHGAAEDRAGNLSRG